MRKKDFRSFLPGLLCLLLNLYSVTIVAQDGDSSTRLPPARLERIRTVDIKHIGLNLRFDWRTRQAYGTATIKFSTLQATQAISLDAAMLSINSITLSNGKTVSFENDSTDKNDNLRILLDRIYQPDEQVALEIAYHTNWINETDPNSTWGSNGKGIRFFEPSTTDKRRKRQIWSMAEYQSNRYWFPAYDGLGDDRTSEFMATVDKGLTAISNGALKSRKENTDGTVTYHWQMDTPYPNYQTSFVVGEYTDTRQQYGDIDLHSYGYPDEVPATTASVERLPDMFDFFSKVTGVRYPFGTYSQVFVQELPWGMENTGMATQTENMVDDYGTHADFLYLWDALEAEAVARQWFGRYITSKDWSESWLTRGFAHYFDKLYNEQKNGRADFLLYAYSFDQSTWLADWNAGIRHPIVTTHYNDESAFATDNYSYIRGALVLHMLRKQLGDEQWWKVIRHYLAANAQRAVTTEDFRASVQAVTGEPMDWFFDQWIYKMGHPVFEVTKSYDEGKKQLTLRVKQMQGMDSTSAYPQTKYFQGKMDIEIDNRIETIWIKPEAENTYVISSQQAPALVNFDYESVWIKELKFDRSVGELLYQYGHDQDILARRNALTSLANLAAADKIDANEKKQLMTAMRGVLAGDLYWRLKYSTLLQLQRLLSVENKPVKLDDETARSVMSLIEHGKTWVRAGAIGVLGITRDPRWADLYIRYFKDSSDRVVNAAAIALGQSRSSKAFGALVKLKDKPSWKNQSLISTLNGLKELGDPRGYEIAFGALTDTRSARWTLAIPQWDYQVTAVETIMALKKGNAAYAYLQQRLNQSIKEDNLNDIFSNLLLITKLADKRAQEVFDKLKDKFKDQTNTLAVLDQYESQFKDNLAALLAKK